MTARKSNTHGGLPGVMQGQSAFRRLVSEPMSTAARFPHLYTRGGRCWRAGANEEPHRAPAGGHNWPAMLVKQTSMDVAYVSTERKITALAAGTLLLSSLSLGGCATSTAGSSLMDSRAEAAPPNTSAYALLGDLPPKREKRGMTPDARRCRGAGVGAHSRRWTREAIPGSTSLGAPAL